MGIEGALKGKVVEELKMKPVEDELRKIAEGIEFEVLENLDLIQEKKKMIWNMLKRLASLGDCYVNEAFGNSHGNMLRLLDYPNSFRTPQDLDLIKR